MGMSVDEPYETGLRDFFHLKPPVPAVARMLWKSEFAVPQVKRDEPNRSLAPPIPSAGAFILSLQRHDFTAHELWLGGRSVPVVPFPKGMMSLVNLALDPTPYPCSTNDCFSLYLRRDTFDRLADGLGGNRIDDLAIRPGVATDDPVIANLGPRLLPAIERPKPIQPDRITDELSGIAIASIKQATERRHPGSDI
jgi:AraC family transcriptional regulator